MLHSTRGEGAAAAPSRSALRGLDGCGPARLTRSVLVLAGMLSVLVAPGKAATSGDDAYSRSCASCHGPELRGGETGPALIGSGFQEHWAALAPEELERFVRKTMPPTNPGALSEGDYAATVDRIRAANGWAVVSRGGVGGAGGQGANGVAGVGGAGGAGGQGANGVAGVAGADGVAGAGGADGVAGAGGAGMGGAGGRAVSGGADSVGQGRADSQANHHAQVEWLNNRGDLASTSYSALAQINRDNVTKLRVAWRWKSDNFGPTPEFYFRATPLMADGVLYTTAGIRRSVVAIDAATGETLWMYRLDEGERGVSGPRRSSGRGVSFWRSTNPQEGSRVFTITPGFQLVALDAHTGLPVTSFGKGGIVDLKQGLPRVDELPKTPPGSSSPPVIVGDVVVVGVAFAAGGAPPSKVAVPGWVRAYDARTGALKWTFHTVPQAGEPGAETWADKSYEYTGNTGLWTPFSADAARGYVYLPIEAATGDFYGGHRHGDDLFSDTLVCVDANTGKRIWHYQIVHHDIWDYDLPAPPVLADITVAGRKIPAVVQVTKMGLAFVFDRVTGKPVWPIEERRVPQSDVPGEKTSPTQPFPTKPAPFEPQGLRREDLIDFTPEMKQQALEIVSHYRFGPAFTPPSVVTEGGNLGSLLRPSLSGGANWQGAAVDPETGVLYVSSISSVSPIGLRQDPKISDMRYIGAYGEGFPKGSLGGPSGLPLIKPPWGRITAINLNTGDHVWMIPNSDTPEWARNNPALAGIKLPRTGSFDQVGLLVTKTLLFAGEGSGLWRAGGGGNKFRAYDKASGAMLHEITLPANQSGIPMTYETEGRQYIVVAVGAKGAPGELIALTLP